MSHLGSAAVIMQRRFEAALAGAAVPDEFAPSVWDEWNAKSPRAQVNDGLAADAALAAALKPLSDQERDGFSFAAGAIQVGFEGFVGLRLNEHALHTWDIDVALDGAATIPSSIAALAVDNLELIGRYTAKPTPGEPRSVTVRTTDPQRRFTVDLTAAGATLTPSDDTSGDGDLEMPAEVFVGSSTDALTPPTRLRSPATRRCSNGSGPPTRDRDPRSLRLPTKEPSDDLRTRRLLVRQHPPHRRRCPRPHCTGDPQRARSGARRRRGRSRVLRLRRAPHPLDARVVAHVARQRGGGIHPPDRPRHHRHGPVHRRTDPGVPQLATAAAIAPAASTSWPGADPRTSPSRSSTWTYATTTCCTARSSTCCSP